MEFTTLELIQGLACVGLFGCCTFMYCAMRRLKDALHSARAIWYAQQAIYEKVCNDNLVRIKKLHSMLEAQETTEVKLPVIPSIPCVTCPHCGIVIETLDTDGLCEACGSKFEVIGA
jgi:hypothetical protein